jgi:hypothetical protein
VKSGPVGFFAQAGPTKLFFEKDIHEKLKNYRTMYDQPSILTKYKVWTLFLMNMLKQKIARNSTGRFHGQAEGLHRELTDGGVDHVFDE